MILHEVLASIQSGAYLDGDEPLFGPFQPPVTDEQLNELEHHLGVPLPSDLREVARVTRGFSAPLDEFSPIFAQPLGWIDNVTPHTLVLLPDGYGNGWIADLNGQQEEETYVAYVSHDPPVFVFQCRGLAQFLTEMTKSRLDWEKDGVHGEVDWVFAERASELWESPPAGIDISVAKASLDHEIRAFSESLPSDAYEIFDMRSPVPGQGFVWGVGHPEDVLVRHGRSRIFAVAQVSDSSEELRA